MLQLVVVLLLLNLLPVLCNYVGQENTIDWNFRHDFCYSRGYCVVLSTKTFSTFVMGRCRNNNTEIKQKEKKD